MPDTPDNQHDQPAPDETAELEPEAAADEPDRIKIEGCAPFDGEHELDSSYFTGHELRIIKRVAGVRAGGLEKALTEGDYDVFIALAVIALRRGAHPHWKEAEGVLLDAPAGNITYIAADTGDDDADPPIQLVQPG